VEFSGKDLQKHQKGTSKALVRWWFLVCLLVHRRTAEKLHFCQADKIFDLAVGSKY